MLKRYAIRGTIFLVASMIVNMILLAVLGTGLVTSVNLAGLGLFTVIYLVISILVYGYLVTLISRKF